MYFFQLCFKSFSLLFKFLISQCNLSLKIFDLLVFSIYYFFSTFLVLCFYSLYFIFLFLSQSHYHILKILYFFHYYCNLYLEHIVFWSYWFYFLLSIFAIKTFSSFFIFNFKSQNLLLQIDKFIGPKGSLESRKSFHLCFCDCHIKSSNLFVVFNG